MMLGITRVKIFKSRSNVDECSIFIGFWGGIFIQFSLSGDYNLVKDRELIIRCTLSTHSLLSWIGERIRLNCLRSLMMMYCLPTLKETTTNFDIVLQSIFINILMQNWCEYCNMSLTKYETTESRQKLSVIFDDWFRQGIIKMMISQ